MPNFYDIDVCRNQFIIKEGDPADKIYIIKEGEFQVTKKLLQREKEEDLNIQDILDNPQKATKLNNKFFKKNITKKIDSYFLQTLFRGKIIGEMDVMAPLEINPTGIYTTTIKCTSQKGSLMYINRSEFQKLAN